MHEKKINTEEIHPETSKKAEAHLEASKKIAIKNTLKKVGYPLVNHGTGLIAEIGEGLSISYSTAALIAKGVKIEEYGYSLLGAGGLIALVTELLHRRGIIGTDKYAIYRIVKEAVAGAVVAGIFVEEFLANDWRSVLIAASLAVAIATSKSTLEILRERKSHHSKLHKVVDYIIGPINGLFIGAGVPDYVFFICRGFGKPVADEIALPITAAIAIGNALSELPNNKVSVEDSKHHRCFQPARAYRTGIYSGDIAAFGFIFLMDLIQTFSKSTDIKDWVFGLAIAVACLFFIRTFANKIINDGKEEHAMLAHHHEVKHPSHPHSDEETKPLLLKAEISEKHEEKKVEEKPSCFYLRQKVTEYYNHFFKKSERELQDKSLRNIVVPNVEPHVEKNQSQP